VLINCGEEEEKHAVRVVAANFLCDEARTISL
jgi:hypothetical protein